MFFLTAEILQVWRKITKFEKFHLKTGADPGGGVPGAPTLKLVKKQHKKNVRFSLKNLQNMPKMFGLATLDDQFKMCAPSKLKSWIRA